MTVEATRENEVDYGYLSLVLRVLIGRRAMGRRNNCSYFFSDFLLLLCF